MCAFCDRIVIILYRKVVCYLNNPGGVWHRSRAVRPGYLVSWSAKDGGGSRVNQGFTEFIQVLSVCYLNFPLNFPLEISRFWKNVEKLFINKQYNLLVIFMQLVL